MTESDKMTKAFIDMIQKEFKFPLLGRLEILADVDHFRKGEDESVWLQSKGKAPEMYEVYWDGEWLMDFAHATEVEITMAIFWQAFLKAYQENRIRLIEGLADLEPKDQTLDNLISTTKKRLVTRTSATSQDNRLADRVVTEIVKESRGNKNAT